jgi:hypothetical protein
MNYSPNWASHLPVLIRILQISEGPVLELGSGIFSTPVMHWLCLESKRRLVTYENVPDYYNMVKRFSYGMHEINLIENWDKIPIENEHWGVAFVDHNPPERRKVEIARLANIADYVVVHDTEARMDAETEFIKKSFPLFKYQYHHMRQKPYTSVLSNFADCVFNLSQP